MPFLIFVCLGVILVLAWNLWKAVFGEQTARAAYLHIVAGSAEMKTWNTEAYFDLSTDVVVRQGDEIRTSTASKIIVEFFDGTLMRLDGGTDVRFEALDDVGKNPEIEVALLEGRLWFNKTYKDTGDTGLKVFLDNVVVNSQAAGVFEVEDGDGQTVRVFDVFDEEGVLVEVLDADGNKVVEEAGIGVGQEIVFTDKVLERYLQFQSPSVLAAVSDEFKQTDWYKWNAQEDASPTIFEKLAGEKSGDLVSAEPKEVEEEKKEEEAQPVEPVEELKPEEPKPAEPVSAGAMIKPTITSVAGVTTPGENGFYLVTSRVATLTGGISGAAKVVVNDFTLQKFKPGDSTWTYFANADFNLMKAGENIYEIYGLDEAGKKSEVLTVKVLYQPPQPVVTEPVPGDTTTSDGTADSTADATAWSTGDQPPVNLDAGPVAPTD